MRRGRPPSLKSRLRSPLARTQWNFPILEAKKIAEEVKGTCRVIVIKKRWEIWVQIALKRSMKDRDIELELNQLRASLWFGYEDEPADRGWTLNRLNVTESTLTLMADYRDGDLKRLREPRTKLRIAPRPANGERLEGAILMLEDAADVYDPSHPRVRRDKGQEDDIPF